MKRVYTNNVVIAEQFTDDCTPEGVRVADSEFILKVLVPSVREQYKGKEIFLFKYPYPSTINKEVAEIFNVPYPFAWIKKGDYVLTYPSGYATVETRESFERDYQEIQLIKE